MTTHLLFLLLACQATPKAPQGHLVVVGGGTTTSEIARKTLSLAGDGLMAPWGGLFTAAARSGDELAGAMDQWRKTNEPGLIECEFDAEKYQLVTQQLR